MGRATASVSTGTGLDLETTRSISTSTLVPVAEMIRRVTEEREIGDLLVENPPIEEIIAKVYGEASNSNASNGDALNEEAAS